MYHGGKKIDLSVLRDENFYLWKNVIDESAHAIFLNGKKKWWTWKIDIENHNVFDIAIFVFKYNTSE